ncbi:hypothetical protein BK133_17820 [Paenibacillus sp. FSL H8-0548]|uniref:DUF5696 domain-containing protein n=1 Tax=Paenibacillus sp. FSL H8-0548 TaxID=1920422 RepID=UPI00096FA902|nr:DUF5696 domain-containing protein [Paenibacillus sp. FSL H8-0548]OMF29393.1 hypothetical protein BK133_17820 [Paenibacillus sp. FSL H8-0548]
MVELIKRTSLRVKLAAIVFLVLIISTLSIVLQSNELAPAKALELAGIEKPTMSRASLYEGEAWKPQAGEDGFAEALANDQFALFIHPGSTQIVLVDKTTGYKWKSNPTEAELGSETVKGVLLANLKSPFVLTYVRTQGKDQTIREVLNASDPNMETSLIKSAEGLQISYEFPERQLSFSIQYELTEKGLKARIPTTGIKEDGEFAVFTIDLLPYFGAASSDEDGYIFVPDGPGGLIRFDTEGVDVSRGYIHQVYGLELTNTGNWSRSGENRESIGYPVFGMKHGSNAFMAVITEGGGSANISAMPPGLKSGLYNVYTNQIYREEYLYRISRLAAPIKAIQKQRLDTDREVEYRFLSGEDADYVGMAKAYRDYMTETGKLKEQLKPVEHTPLYLKIMGGNYTEAFNKIKYITATTFPQATNIVNGLVEQGVANLKVIYYGWQNQGDYDLYDRFPIEKALGGEAAAKDFISEMSKQQIDVMFEDDFVWIDSENSDLSGKTNGIRGIDETVFVEEGWFISKPGRTVAMAYETMAKLKEIGVSGILFNWIGEMVFHDYDPSGIATRSDTIAVYEGLLAYARETLGSAAVYRGNDYAAIQSDYIAGLPSESSYDFMVDETVPFYPIALHGYVSYSFGDGNLRNDVETEFLKAIEYGAVPSFFLTHEDSRVLKYTAASFLFSSQYEKWIERILKEYKDFDSLSSVYAQRIMNHEKLSEDRFATVYEDGTRVIVDYGSKSFVVEKGDGA